MLEIKYNRLLSYKSGKMFLVVGAKNGMSKDGVWLIGYMAPYFSEKVMIYFPFDDFAEYVEYVEDERLLYNPSLESFDDYRARLAKLFDRALSEEQLMTFLELVETIMRGDGDKIVVPRGAPKTQSMIRDAVFLASAAKEYGLTAQQIVWSVDELSKTTSGPNCSAEEVAEAIRATDGE